jgi:hypothetical protein
VLSEINRISSDSDGRANSSGSLPKVEAAIMAKATGTDVKALILRAMKEPNQPGSVHNVKPSHFLSFHQSIWKYSDGAVFRLEVDDPNHAKALLRSIQPTDYEWSTDKTILVVLWNEPDLAAMIRRGV